MNKVFGLIDSNAFYVSCDTIFNPKMAGKPAVVMSNSDGCVIARNDLSKALGIKMGDLLHTVKPFVKSHNLFICSSNYTLYQDISNRIVKIISDNVPAYEVYSIDECFVDLTGIADLEAFCLRIKKQIYREVGMPVGIGVGPTKTLAKLNNWASKKWKTSTGGVVVILDSEKQNKLLSYADCSEVWGIGRKLTNHLKLMGVEKAIQLAQYDKAMLRKMFSINIEKTSRELLGESCYKLSEGPEPKKSIVSSKMFGKRVSSLSELKEAVATYTARAAMKLRRDNQLCKTVEVFIQTSRFDDRPYFKSIIIKLESPTSDTRDFVAAAQEGLEQIYREGYLYSKAGVMLTGFIDREGYVPDLFAKLAKPNSERLMGLMDYVNSLHGRGTIRFAQEPLSPSWKSKANYLSPCYTTKWEDLPKIKNG